MNSHTANMYIHQEVNTAGHPNNTTTNKTNRAVALFREAVVKDCQAQLASLNLDRLVPQLSQEEMVEYMRMTAEIEAAAGNVMARIEERLK